MPRAGRKPSSQMRGAGTDPAAPGDLGQRDQGLPNIWCPLGRWRSSTGLPTKTTSLSFASPRARPTTPAAESKRRPIHAGWRPWLSMAPHLAWWRTGISPNCRPPFPGRHWAVLRRLPYWQQLMAEYEARGEWLRPLTTGHIQRQAHGIVKDDTLIAAAMDTLWRCITAVTAPRVAKHSFCICTGKCQK